MFLFWGLSAQELNESTAAQSPVYAAPWRTKSSCDLLNDLWVLEEVW